MRNGRMELLAPAGSPEAVLAAARCGADAVYLGMSAFNARRHARNFESTEALKGAVDYCHLNGMKAYLTLNTLILESEMDKAIAVAEQAASVGVDAFIVQDLGLARRLHTCAPNLRLHASTQLSCHTPEGVRTLAESGFSRVVLAREMSMEEIRACAGLGCELEVFVHGALCMSVSGQCYLSAMLGGRSGNRGACAQPCRLPFSPNGNRATDTFALSLKDQSLTEHIRELQECGVDSLKIEGRMKRPEYVAAAVTTCAAAIEGKEPIGVDQQDLQAVFSRTGFTDGYFTGKRTDMFGIRRTEDANATASVVKRLEPLFQKERAHIPVTLDFSFAVGKTATLSVSDEDGHSVTVMGAVGETAIHKPLDVQRAKEALAKTGGTPFVAKETTVSIEGNATLPISAINAMRREALELLSEQRQMAIPCVFDALKRPLNSVGNINQGKPLLVARLANMTQFSPELHADAVALPLSAFEKPLSITPNCPIWVEVPRGLFGTSDTLVSKLKQAAAQGVEYALCNNIGALQPILDAGLKPVGGFGLNITNADALEFYREKGLAGATVSMELTFAQMCFVQNAAIPCGVMAYGRQPLMLMRNCPRRGGVGCGKHGCQDGLVDRKGIRFPLACENGCTELLNSSVLYWADRKSEIPNMQFWLLHFTDETPEWVAQTVNEYRFGGKHREGITRGLYRRGLSE